MSDKEGLPRSAVANIAKRSDADFPERLAAMTQRAGLGLLEPHSVVRLTAGASQQTFAFAARTEAAKGGGIVQFILRRLPPGAEPHDSVIGPEREAALIALAARVGVPTPRVRHVLDGNDGLGRGFVSDRIAGETLPRRILRDAAFAALRPRLAEHCGRTLARLHAAPIVAAPPLPMMGAREKLKALRAVYDRIGIVRPAFVAALRWLDAHMPSPVPPVLVHGDFRLGNLMLTSDGLAAVLDWELAHLGDPAEDLGWITLNSWRFGNRHLPVGGFGTEEQLIAGYVAAGGAPISRQRLRFWRILGTLSWGLMCLDMAQPPTTGEKRTIERAVIGRRSSEAELDLLDSLLEEDAR